MEVLTQGLDLGQDQGLDQDQGQDQDQEGLDLVLITNLTFVLQEHSGLLEDKSADALDRLLVP